MPKAFSAVCLTALVSIGFINRAGAQELPRKLKRVPACRAIETAAATNHIPVTGIDRTFATNVLHAGDCVTILGTMFQKKKETQWLLYVESGPPGTNTTNRPPWVIHMFGKAISFESRPVPATLRMLGPFTASDAPQSKFRVQTAHFSLNESFLGLGLERTAAVVYHRHQTNNATHSNKSADAHESNHADTPRIKPTLEEQRAIAGAIPALTSYFEIVQNTDGLEDLLSKLVELPSVWSIVRHLGVNPAFYFGKEASPANPADWELPPNTPVYYLPCVLTLNKQPAIKVTFVVTVPDPPRLICAGIVGLLAEKPDDDQIYMTMRVVSAKCLGRP